MVINNAYVNIVNTLSSLLFSLKALPFPASASSSSSSFLFLPSLFLYYFSLSNPPFHKYHGPLALLKSSRDHLGREPLVPDKDTEAQRGEVTSEGSHGSGQSWAWNGVSWHSVLGAEGLGGLCR